MITASQALTAVPDGLRQPLLVSFGEISRNFAEHRWEPAELNGGKFSEVVYGILVGALDGRYPAGPAKPPNMLEACRALEGRVASATRIGDRSLRILIPRILPVLYEIRNNRGVGHAGGDVNPNYQDAVAVYQMASWVMAELVRIFHKVSIDDAQQIVNVLVERKHPIVWQEGSTRRVLDPALPKADQVILLLYSVNAWIEEKQLKEWVEYTNLTQFRKRILVPLHELRLVEYDNSLRRVYLTPLGSDRVEQQLLPKYKV